MKVKCDCCSCEMEIASTEDHYLSSIGGYMCDDCYDGISEPAN